MVSCSIDIKHFSRTFGKIFIGLNSLKFALLALLSSFKKRYNLSKKGNNYETNIKIFIINKQYKNGNSQ